MPNSDTRNNLNDFKGRGAAVFGLCKAFMSGAPVHAVLIAGPEGAGKRTLAALLAQSLHCEAEARPCGVCPSCRRFFSGSLPDAHLIEQKSRVGIDEIRALTEELHRVAFEGGAKTVRIEGASAMTPQAQNSLLKTLEEPPGNTYFLLTTVSFSQVLPTIRSRCAQVSLPPVSLREAPAETGDEQFWSLRARVADAMEGIRAPSDVWAAVDAMKGEKDVAGKIVNLLEDFLRGALRQNLLGEGAVATPFERCLSLADAGSLVKLLEAVTHMRRMLASNVPWQAVLERFVFIYAEERVKWQS